MSEEFYRKGIASDPQLSQQYDRFRLIGQPGWRFCDKCWGCSSTAIQNKGALPCGRGASCSRFSIHSSTPWISKPVDKHPTQTKWSALYRCQGVGFEPNQTVLINHELKFHPSGAFQPEGIPSRIFSDSEGRWFALIPIAQDVSYVKVSAFDFGSGETAIASIG